MFRTLMKSKIHRATVTQADLHYVGSVTISADLMAEANLVEGEKVDIVDIDNGNRLSTYVIEGPAGSGTIGINGAAARLISVGDLVIIIAYALVAEEEVKALRPRVVFVDRDNKPVHVGSDPAAAPEGSGLIPGDVPADIPAGA
ncbi:aspartate 1-decarboxylase [Microbispora triticiradicis]|uniref:Aspartate 1-decarboxylase n=3 Tax=Microbispora TaxID=2005 RepID=A0ABY3LQV6_9ACTN|nr:MULTISPECIES: aspartate 1-decarboxylase [Microbispora]RGA04909.1 aspartate 1-decarboxylase [Microbispora triticiradicis]TLP55744.1 aspartate 1-decarboxylase [Microbispora fusca]TYB50528.1 aspartate 1-decarboxylase [Microbispora tritici]GLW24815.1 aspartate 1-decarboxylase [Microbispora amethystogenes]